MFFDNSMDNRKTEAGPKVFGSEKWVEYPRDMLLLDSFPGIANGNVQRFSSLAVLRQQMGDERLAAASFGGNGELAPTFHRVHRIQEEIQENLLHLICVCPNRIDRCVPLPGDFDLLLI